MKKTILTTTLLLFGFFAFSQYQEGMWRATTDMPFDISNDSIIYSYTEAPSNYYFDIELSFIYSNFPSRTTYNITKKTKINGNPVYHIIDENTREAFVLVFFNDNRQIRFLNLKGGNGFDFFDCTINGKKQLSNEDPMKHRRKYVDEGQASAERAYEQERQQMIELQNEMNNKK